MKKGIRSFLSSALLLIFAVPLFAADVAKSLAGNTKDITFDNLKFAMKKGDAFKRSLLTENIEKLQGREIRLRGYILPCFQQKGITEFVLVRDNMECCFGPGAALYDCVMVNMKAGKSCAFSIRPVSVIGKFELSEFKGPDGKHLAIYKMVGEEVKPL